MRTSELLNLPGKGYWSIFGNAMNIFYRLYDIHQRLVSKTSRTHPFYNKVNYCIWVLLFQRGQYIPSRVRHPLPSPPNGVGVLWVPPSSWSRPQVRSQSASPLYLTKWNNKKTFRVRTKEVPFGLVYLLVNFVIWSKIYFGKGGVSLEIDLGIPYWMVPHFECTVKKLE